MARITTGGPLAMDFFMAGDPSVEQTAYLRQQAMLNLQHLGPQHGALLQDTMTYVTQVHQSAAVRGARAVLAKSNMSYMVNAFYPVTTLEALQNPPMVMMPFIMAEPTTRALYHAQRVEGYYGVYEDPQPGVVGPGHVHHDLAMHGVSVPSPDGKREQFIQYVHTNPNSRLNFDQQLAVQRTWAALKAQIALGEDDPTSQYGGQIG